MKGYGQFCPVAMACEIFAERWTPLILRELLAGRGAFNEIRQGMPMISRTLLAQRLRELEDAGIIQSQPVARGRGREYRLTAAGRGVPGGPAAARGMGSAVGHHPVRAGQPRPDAADVEHRRRIAFDRLPDRRIVVRFDFRAFPARCRPLRTSWLILERSGSDVCLKDPGFDVDLVVAADAGAMARVWTGAVSFARAVQEGGLRVEGPRDLVRALPTWLLLSHFAHVERRGRVSTAR